MLKVGSESGPSTSSNSFDLATRLEFPPKSPRISYIPPGPTSPLPSLDQMTKFLSENPNIPVRLVLPSLLSPLFYPPQATKVVAPYLHRLRSLLRQYVNLIAVLSWPLALFPHNHVLTRFMKRIIDGIISLEAFPSGFSIDSELLEGKRKENEDESMQGFIRVKKLPALTERGMGVGSGDQMVFSMSRRQFTVKPFNLPPLESGQGDQAEASAEEKAKSKALEF